MELVTHPSGPATVDVARGRHTRTAPCTTTENATRCAPHLVAARLLARGDDVRCGRLGELGEVLVREAGADLADRLGSKARFFLIAPTAARGELSNHPTPTTRRRARRTEQNRTEPNRTNRTTTRLEALHRRLVAREQVRAEDARPLALAVVRADWDEIERVGSRAVEVVLPPAATAAAAATTRQNGRVRNSGGGGDGGSRVRDGVAGGGWW